MSDIVSLFTQSIDKKLHLKRKQKCWQLSENKVTIEFKMPNRKSLGFSLDAGKAKDVFGFFAGDPPTGVAAMCDGIIVLNYKKQTYVVLLEQKTKCKGEYRKQLINGWYFCQWLFSLLKEHKHYSGEIKYIGLLCRVRQNIIKGESAHSEPEPEPKSKKNGIQFFETNEKITHLESYIKAIQ